jgi:hypothetical protein
LHLIDPSKDLVDEVARFVRDEGVLSQNPLDPDSPEPNLLIIFDGLDELASQGKAAAETARAFVREVDRVVERRNAQKIKLRVLISGRELLVQENESEFRRPRQILTLLPYLQPKPRQHDWQLVLDGEEYHDPNRLLEHDLRQDWWANTRPQNKARLHTRITALLIPPLLARIRAEETLLRAQFGAEYEAYRARTSRLIPGLY